MLLQLKRFVQRLKDTVCVPLKNSYILDHSGVLPGCLYNILLYIGERISPHPWLRCSLRDFTGARAIFEVSRNKRDSFAPADAISAPTTLQRSHEGSHGGYIWRTVGFLLLWAYLTVVLVLFDGLAWSNHSDELCRIYSVAMPRKLAAHAAQMKADTVGFIWRLC